MERFVTEPATIKEQNHHVNQDTEVENFEAQLDSSDSKISDLRLADSFLDFDSIKEFFEGNSPNSDRIGLKKIEFGVPEKSVKMSEEEKSSFGNVKTEETLECGKEKNLSGNIEEEMGKVSLAGAKSEIVSGGDGNKRVDLVGDMVSVSVDESGAKSGTVSDEESESDSESESESSTSSSSSSSSSSDDDEEEEEDEEPKEEVKEVKIELRVRAELEEGEIEVVDGEETAGGIDDDRGDDHEEDEEDGEEKIAGVNVDIDDWDEIGGGAMEGPIRSKNELQVLPPVPQVNVALQPHYQVLPVGVVLLVLGLQVIVEGVEKHNPLNEGSILWITESRLPLGLIDEIFGPVKSPYYVVRYNSESEIPARIYVGTSISFVQDFANHVLNDKNLYKKGYDASGENDEEFSDEAEFSDDEKEAEYKRRQKMEKRGMNDQKPGNKKNNRKKVRNKDGMWRNDKPSVPRMDGGQLPANQNQLHVSHVPISLNHGNCSTSSIGQGFVGGTGLAAQLPQMVQNTGFRTSSNGVWTSGIPSQQSQSAFFPNVFPTNGLPWPSQNYQQQPYQPMMNGGLFPQQSSQMSLPNVGIPGGPSNFFAGPAYAPWQGLVGQYSLNQTFGRGLPGQPAYPSVHAGQGGIRPPNGLHVEQNNLQQAAVLPDSNEAPQQFNMGASSSRERRPYPRGGRRFAGGRGRHQSK